MLLEKLKENTKEVKKDNVKGNFIIKGVIHIVDEDGTFEVLHETFFYTGLETNGYFLSQDDIDVYLSSELPTFDWKKDIEPKIDECYSILFKFDLRSEKYWTDCGYEYDTIIDIIDYHIIKVSEKATKLYLEEYDKEEDYFQFEGD